MLPILTVVLALLASALSTIAAQSTPEQIHLSLGQSQNDWWCNWVTFDPTPASYVAYGTDPTKLTQTAKATETLFVDGGSAQKKRYMHEAAMPSLKPGQTYFYAISANGSSTFATQTFNFSTIPSTAGYTTPLRIAMYGQRPVT